MLRKLYLLLAAVVSGPSLTYAQPAVRLQADAVLTLPAGAGLTAIADGDFNHDNRRDLAVCERNLDQVALYMRSAAGTYPTAKFTYPVGPGPTGLVSFNRLPPAYHADLMALSGPGSGWTMLRDDGDTTGQLVRRVYPTNFGTAQPSARPVLLATDLNRDGNPEFVYTYPVIYSSVICFSSYANDVVPPSWNYSRSYPTPYFNTAVNRSSNLIMADFDANGGLDVVLADSANHAVHLVSGVLSQNLYRFYPAELLNLQTSGRGPVATAAADIDGDQLPDLAVAYAGSNAVMVLRNQPAPFDFNRQYAYLLPASPRRVLLVDLNRDFLPELVVVTADNQLRVYQHNGVLSALAYTTIPPQVLATGVSPSLLQIAELNNDNYPDLVVGCAGDNTVHTYLNRSGTVSAARANQALPGVDVYPTRATDGVTVTQAVPRPLAATLLDELGHMVRRQELTQPSTRLALGDVPRGLYLLRLTGAAGTRTTRLVLQ